MNKQELITGSAYGDLLNIVCTLNDPTHLQHAMGLGYTKPVAFPIVRDLYRAGLLVMYKYKKCYFVTLKTNTEIRERPDGTFYRFLENIHGVRAADKLFSDVKALGIINKLIEENSSEQARTMTIKINDADISSDDIAGVIESALESASYNAMDEDEAKLLNDVTNGIEWMD